MPERIGVADLGSNTTRLVVLEYTPHHSFKLLDEVRETVRLAEGMIPDGRLQAAPMARAIAAMKMFSSFCVATKATRFVPVATSAVREARNQAEFLQRLEKETGVQIQVLSAEEEAFYGYLGVVNSLSLSDGFSIDIGGGSTQVSLIRGRGFVKSFSRPIGALRASERFVRSDPISKSDFRALELGVAETFAELDALDNFEQGALAGIGGTIRTIATIDQKMNNYPLDRVHGYSFTQERLAAIIELLRGMTLREREALPGLSRERADLILAGAVILNHVMQKGKFASIMVSGQGIREGLFYEHFLVGESPALIGDLRGFSVHNLARNYNYEAIHAAKVRELALSMFDQLSELHGYGHWERELLGYAALLHDIGVTVSYYDHHKHGAYLVLNAALSGFNHREIAIIASLVRGHRKGEITVSPFGPMLQADDESRIARLAALLRLAEYLERRKSQVIQGLRVEIGTTIKIVTRASGDASVEIWDANRRSGLFQKSFGRPIEIV